MSNKERLAAAIIRVFCGFITMVSLVFTLYRVGPWLETRYFPVVSKLDILSAEPRNGGMQTELRAAFRKNRDCEYIGLAWFVGDRATQFDRVSIILMRDQNDTSSPSRPLGYQKAGPWLLSIPPDDVRKRSFAQLFHRCHPFWTTVTEFYP